MSDFKFTDAEAFGGTAAGFFSAVGGLFLAAWGNSRSEWWGPPTFITGFVIVVLGGSFCVFGTKSASMKKD